MHVKLIGKWFVTVLLSYTFASLSLFAAEPPEIAAKSYLLIDYHSQVVLASKDADKRIEPASITKLMTAYVLYKELQKGNISTDDLVLISEKAWRMKGSRMFVEANKRVPFERLMNGLIIQSGNDAAVALAEHSYGTEASFVSRMNSEAKRLGMNNTNFVNATGWPDKNHYSTANDIAMLTRTVIAEFPEEYKEYKIKEYSYNGIKQYNRNKLLWLDPTVDGVKTGHTESAGYCLVSSAQRNGMRLISVVIGADSVKARSFASQQLLEYGYQFFETNKIYAANHVVEEIRIWKGDKEKVAVGFVDDFYVTVAKGTYSSLKGNISYESGVDAPIYRGDKLGKVVLRNAQDKVVLEAPLEALETVTGGGIWRKVTDGVQKVFH